LYWVFLYCFWIERDVRLVEVNVNEEPALA